MIATVQMSTIKAIPNPSPAPATPVAQTKLVLAARVAQHHAGHDDTDQLAAELDGVRRPIELGLLAGWRLDLYTEVKSVCVRL